MAANKQIMNLLEAKGLPHLGEDLNQCVYMSVDSPYPIDMRTRQLLIGDLSLTNQLQKTPG